MAKKKSSRVQSQATIVAGSKRIPVHTVSTAVWFPAGTYRFSVGSAAPQLEPNTALKFPAMLVASGPGASVDCVEFAANRFSKGEWLYAAGNEQIIKIGQGGASLVFSSFHVSPDAPLLEVHAERVSTVAGGALLAAARKEQLSLSVLAHFQGEEQPQRFTSGQWIGRPELDRWIEAITVEPHEALGADGLEYKGLAANGYETPWLKVGALCGTRGLGLPLIGFAFRLGPALAETLDAQCSTRFWSGAVAGPVKSGVPCRSPKAGDAIVALQLLVGKRAPSALSAEPVVHGDAVPPVQPGVASASEIPRSKARRKTASPADTAKTAPGDGAGKGARSPASGRKRKAKE